MSCPREREPTTAERKLIDAELRLVEAACAEVPDLSSFCFGHMRLSQDGPPLDVLLGSQTFIRPGITLINWQKAPLAAVFFGTDVGQPYEVERENRPLIGTLLARYLLGFAGTELAEISTAQLTLTCRDRDHWAAVERTADALLLPRPEGAGLSTAVALDPVQRRAVELGTGASLLVLGEAGFGKTTVALHRLAHLRDQAPKRPFSALVLVPTEGLRRLCTLILSHLSLAAVEVLTFDAWISTQARKVFTRLPKRNSENTSLGVMRLKRHPALRTVLPEVAGRTVETKRGRKKPPTSRPDLLHLFGNRSLLERVVAASGGELRETDVGSVVAHTKIQFSEPTEVEYAGVDETYLRTVDGLAIDAGTPLEDAKSMDVEDGAVLFAINRLRTGRDRTPKGRLETYDHIVVDEAQELSPLELSVIGRARGRQGTLTVAGDEHQQIDETASFQGWPATMGELGLGAYERIVLQTSYRCPPEITHFARGLLTGGAKVPDPASHAPILLTRYDNECHLVAALVAALVELTDHDPYATIAVICHEAEAARRMERNLARGLPTALALNGQFDFEPGISVTSVAEVKGLEFDYVIVPDATAAIYPDTSEAKRALYVAATRAIHHLWLAVAEPLSPLVVVA